MSNTKHTPGPEQVDRLRRRLQFIMHQVDELERRTGKGGWFAETIQEACDGIAKDFGFRPYHEGFAADAEGAIRHRRQLERERAAIAKATGSAT